MLMIEFSCGDPDPTGASLGDIAIATESGIVSSADQKPDQSVMIFLSVPLLLDALGEMLEKRDVKKKEFVGVDSSFSLVFTRAGAGRLAIRYKNQTVWDGDEETLVRAVIEAADQFVSKYGSRLSPDDMAYEDLLLSVGSFKRLAQRVI